MSDRNWLTLGVSIFMLLSFLATDCANGPTVIETARILETKYVEPYTSVDSRTDDKGRVQIDTTYHPGYWNVWVLTNAGAKYKIQSERGKFGDHAVVVSTRLGKWTGVAWARGIEESR